MDWHKSKTIYRFVSIFDLYVIWHCGSTSKVEWIFFVGVKKYREKTTLKGFLGSNHTSKVYIYLQISELQEGK